MNTLVAQWLLNEGDEGFDPNYAAPSIEEQRVYRTVVVDGVNGPMEVGYHGPESRGEQIKAWHMNLKNRIVHHDAITTADAQEPVLSRSQQALLRQTGKVTNDANGAAQRMFPQQGQVLSRAQKNVQDRATRQTTTDWATISAELDKMGKGQMVQDNAVPAVSRAQQALNKMKQANK